MIGLGYDVGLIASAESEFSGTDRLVVGLLQKQNYNDAQIRMRIKNEDLPAKHRVRIDETRANAMSTKILIYFIMREEKGERGNWLRLIICSFWYGQIGTARFLEHDVQSM